MPKYLVDDCYFSIPHSSGYQPPLELLRHILSEGGTYDRHRKEFQKTEEAAFLASATLPSAPGTITFFQKCSSSTLEDSAIFLLTSLFLKTILLSNVVHNSNWLNEDLHGPLTSFFGCVLNIKMHASNFSIVLLFP